MVCENPSPYYVPKNLKGLRLVNSVIDGYSMLLKWHRAFPSSDAYKIAYNIYYSTLQENLFSEGPKFVSNNPSLSSRIYDFSPGDTYYFAVRAMQYSTSWFNVNDLNPSEQEDTYLKLYPQTLLSESINDTTTSIPITDPEIFPPTGIIKAGYELIFYSGVDLINSLLINAERGFLGTNPRIHQEDGYDGYVYQDPVINFFNGFEDKNTFIIQEQCKFDTPHEVYTIPDGYKQVNMTGILTTDLSFEEKERIDFPSYDYVGWHRTDPASLFNGTCLDTYIGGEMFCADGYNGINGQIRNMPIQDQADRREELNLELTGKPCVLLRRKWDGIVNSSYDINDEYPDPRHPYGFGTQLQSGYEQFFNTRRSDRRVLVRFSPTTEDLKMQDAGLELDLVFQAWTLSTPIVRDRDVIICYNLDGSEDSRYEIMSVERNTLLFGYSGLQKMTLSRVRKTSPIYQVKVVRDLAMFPQQLITTAGIILGPNKTPIVHSHTIVINENITNISQITQMTSYDQGHNHVVSGGIIQPSVGPKNSSGYYSNTGHTHEIILP